LHGLVNNAGIALPGPLEHLPLDTFRRQIEVNLVGQLAVTQAMLPALRRGADARIVMIGSIGGLVAGPMLGGYHASKFGLVGLAGSLRAELAPFGIRVVLIEPGAVATPIWQRGTAAGDALASELPAQARRYDGQVAKARSDAARNAANGLAPERVAVLVLRAMTDRRPAPRLRAGPDARVAAILVRLLPQRAVYRLLAARA
jgi:NAD(P)-dependent dehydrogenase (short-subunit alcohol dehydrogenase family)